jgi:hypothetical protein
MIANVRKGFGGKLRNSATITSLVRHSGAVVTNCRLAQDHRQLMRHVSFPAESNIERRCAERFIASAFLLNYV